MLYGTVDTEGRKVVIQTDSIVALHYYEDEFCVVALANGSSYNIPQQNMPELVVVEGEAYHEA